MAKGNGAIYAVLIVMVAVFVVGTVAITFSGYATAGSQIGAPSVYKSCWEQDAGIDTRGGTKTWNTEREEYDKCINSRTVEENWCDQYGDIHTQIMPCEFDEDRCVTEYGRCCRNGVCMN